MDVTRTRTSRADLLFLPFETESLNQWDDTLTPGDRESETRTVIASKGEPPKANESLGRRRHSRKVSL